MSTPRVTVTQEWYEKTKALLQKINNELPLSPEMQTLWLECEACITPTWTIDQTTINLHAVPNNLMGLEAIDLWYEVLKEASELANRTDMTTQPTPLVIRQLCTIARHAGVNVALAILERHLIAEIS